jgi:hypothetical protein
MPDPTTTDIDALLRMLNQDGWENYHAALTALIAERDALAKRVAELEAKPDPLGRVALVAERNALLGRVAEQSNLPSSHRSFLELPITHYETEWNGEWSRRVAREGTVMDLLNTWDIDDPDERSEIAQVLRHLRDAKAIAAERGWDCFKEGGGA